MSSGILFLPWLMVSLLLNLSRSWTLDVIVKRAQSADSNLVNIVMLCFILSYCLSCLPRCGEVNALAGSVPQHSFLYFSCMFVFTGIALLTAKCRNRFPSPTGCCRSGGLSPTLWTITGPAILCLSGAMWSSWELGIRVLQWPIISFVKQKPRVNQNLRLLFSRRDRLALVQRREMVRMLSPLLLHI